MLLLPSLFADAVCCCFLVESHPNCCSGVAITRRNSQSLVHSALQLIGSVLLAFEVDTERKMREREGTGQGPSDLGKSLWSTVLEVAKALKWEQAWWVQYDHRCGLDMHSRECGNRSLRAAGLDHIRPCRVLNFIIRTGTSFILPRVCVCVCVFHSIQEILTKHLMYRKNQIYQYYPDSAFSWLSRGRDTGT